MYGTTITSLPVGLQVKNTIYIARTPLSENKQLVQEYKNKGYKLSL